MMFSGKLSELTYDANAIVQRYIEKPLLIGGYKFDLRLYVCVPSYHPVTVYMYNEGLARFGTDKFNLNDLRNPFRHLTNTSLNKLGPGYLEMKDRIGSGCKWTLRQLRRYFQQAGISDWLLWQRISCLVVLTLLSHMAQVPPTVNCFEFFGFDVLVDSSLRPWLLEVNLSPALGNDCDADRIVKKPMLHDLFDLLGLPLYNTGLQSLQIWSDEASSGSNSSSNENKSEDVKIRKKNSAITVVTAAGKWRRKQRKSAIESRVSSAKNKPNKIENSNVLSKVQQKSRRSKSPPNKTLVKPITYQANFADPSSQSKQANDEIRKIYEKRCWGNGRNWALAPVTEGGWIRLWPFKNSKNFRDMSTRDTKMSVKFMVGEINKFSKMAKMIPKKYPTASETEWSNLLKQSMDLSTEIWLPIK